MKLRNTQGGRQNKGALKGLSSAGKELTAAKDVHITHQLENILSVSRYSKDLIL